MSMKFNQKGFAAVEAVLIIVVMAIIGGTGYYAYSANKKTSDTLNNAAKVAQSSPQKTKKKTSQPTSKAPVPVVDDKTAIIAIAKSYAANFFASHSSETPDFTYTITNVTGINARVSASASTGDSQQFFLQKENGKWQVVYFGHIPSTNTCSKYALPSNWCTLSYPN